MGKKTERINAWKLAFSAVSAYHGDMNAEQIEKKVIAYCKQHQIVEAGDHVLLGLSGGGDSVCLFHMLLALQKEIAFSLKAVHIHHGIRREAELDKNFVEKLCREKGIACESYYENVLKYAKEKGLSEEEAGRVLRYQDFRKSLKNWGNTGAFKIATAHHMDDQAETVLFQLFRGSGLTGLCGIRYKREDIIRPLLCITRKEIECYLQERNLEYCHDQTNDQDYYARNKIRHHILPYAEQEICQGVVEHIGSTAEILQEADAYIQKQVLSIASRIMKKQDKRVSISISQLRNEDLFMQKQLLLYALTSVTESRKDVGHGHIQSILKLLEKEGNGRLSLPHHTMVRKEYDCLWMYSEQEMDSQVLDWSYETQIISLEDEEEIKQRFSLENREQIMDLIPEKAYTKWFDYDRIKSGLVRRHRMQGDFLTINDAYARKSLKEYMIENKIPRELRDCLWVFADGSHVIWIPGYRISSYYKVTKETKRILQITIKQMEEEVCQST